MKNCVRHWGRFYRLSGLLLTGSLCGTKKHQRLYIYKSYYIPQNDHQETLYVQESIMYTGKTLPKESMKFHDQIRSVTQSCPTLCDPMNLSTPGLPVHHQLSEFTQTHVHRVSDAIQPSHPLSSPSPLAPNPSQHQSLFQ